MKLANLLRLILTLCILLSPAVNAQHQIDTARGDWNSTKVGILAGNNVEVTFYNFGEFGDWMNRPARSFNWPTGSGHVYLAGSAFILQARVITHSGSVIHPLETNYYEYTRYDPRTAITYGWWPLAGYDQPGQFSPGISSQPETWPVHWPDKPADWDGQWNGYFGKGVTPGLTETYFVMDDDVDRQYLPVFHPDSVDSTMGGLGIKVRVRALEWSAEKAADMIVIEYKFTNQGTVTYDSTFVALYVDYSIGGYDNSSNNDAAVVPQLQLFTARCTSELGLPGNWSPVGVLGIVMLHTPEENGLTGARVFQVHEYDLNNDEHNWTALSARSYEIPDMSAKNSACFLSSGPFTLSPAAEKSFVVGYIFAEDSLRLIERVNFAREFYSSGFNDSLLTTVSSTQSGPLSFVLDQNFPNPFNPSTTIRYGLPKNSQVTLTVYNTLGQEVTTLVQEEREAGYHEVRFDATGLSSGVYFYRLQAGDYVATKKFLLLR